MIWRSSEMDNIALAGIPQLGADLGSFSERASIEKKYCPIMLDNPRFARLVSYVGNKTIPLLRLYRFKEAFSLGLVNHFLDRFEASPSSVVFDPFCGMGTTLFGSMLRGMPSIGVERLPVAAFVAETLPKLLMLEPGSIISAFEGLKEHVDSMHPAPIAEDVSIVSLAFDDVTLTRLRKWKSAINTLSSPMSEILTLLFLSMLESTSLASNDGQFLRLKRCKKPVFPDEALLRKVLQAEADVIAARYMWPDRTRYAEHIPMIHRGDTRDLSSLDFTRKPTIIITSPPYPNRYDYTRSYSLELCFQFVKNFQELKRIRFGILRSHIESKSNTDDRPVHPAVAEVLNNLDGRKLNNPRIPIMLTAYFVDMRKCICEWSSVLAQNSRVALVVDNVRFEGQEMPVDLILCDLAEQAGFRIESIIVARHKGNSSQQMGRYGRVPVRESIVVWSKP